MLSDCFWSSMLHLMMLDLLPRNRSSGRIRIICHCACPAQSFFHLPGSYMSATVPQTRAACTASSAVPGMYGHPTPVKQPRHGSCQAQSHTVMAT